MCIRDRSCPIMRNDNNKAKYVVAELWVKLSNINIPLIYNDNISEDCLGKGGLHLNLKGSGRLASNFISYNRRH